MRVFVAGATGVLGKRAVRLLVEGGHTVTAVARSQDKAALLEALGTTPVTVDLFDAAAVKSAVAGHDAVLNLATHIPAGARAALRTALRHRAGARPPPRAAPARPAPPAQARRRAGGAQRPPPPPPRRAAAAGRGPANHEPRAAPGGGPPQPPRPRRRKSFAT